MCGQIGVYLTVTHLGGQETCTRVWKRGMISLLYGLEKKTKERYELKVKVAGWSSQDDPNLMDRSGQWSEELVSSPKIEYEIICSYFISRPGTFTLQLLTSWRQLEAYNYFKNNYVRTVFSYICDWGRCVVVNAKVNQSQKFPDLAHEAWILARKKGLIASAHYTVRLGKTYYYTFRPCGRKSL